MVGFEPLSEGIKDRAVTETAEDACCGCANMASKGKLDEEVSAIFLIFTVTKC